MWSGFIRKTLLIRQTRHLRNKRGFGLVLDLSFSIVYGLYNKRYAPTEGQQRTTPLLFGDLPRYPALAPVLLWFRKFLELLAICWRQFAPVAGTILILCVGF